MKLLSLAMKLALICWLAGLTAAPAQAQFDCQYSGYCYTCKWYQGTGFCFPYSTFVGWCRCDEPGPGSGCIMWDSCSPPRSAQLSVPDDRRCSDTLPGNHKSAVHDWTVVVATQRAG